MINYFFPFNISIFIIYYQTVKVNSILMKIIIKIYFTSKMCNCNLISKLKIKN